MNQCDRSQFAVVMAGVYDFWKRDLSDIALDIWWETLKGYTLEEVQTALTRHMRDPDTGQYIPKPADVVKHLGGTTADASMLAWSKVMVGVKKAGTYESVAFDDPIIHRVLVDLGGWAWMGHVTDKELPFVEKRFRDAYRAWMRKGIVWDPITHLPGIVETHNRGIGRDDKVPRPVLIGDRAKAAQIACIPEVEPKKIAEAKT